MYKFQKHAPCKFLICRRRVTLFYCTGKSVKVQCLLRSFPLRWDCCAGRIPFRHECVTCIMSSWISAYVPPGHRSWRNIHIHSCSSVPLLFVVFLFTLHQVSKFIVFPCAELVFGICLPLPTNLFMLLSFVTSISAFSERLHIIWASKWNSCIQTYFFEFLPRSCGKQNLPAPLFNYGIQFISPCQIGQA